MSQDNDSSERIYDRQFELRQDNDFLHFTDRYYSTGSFIGFRKMLDSTGRADKRHFSLHLVQEIFTPADLDETDTRRLHRPYAGFLGLINGLTYSNSKRIWDFKLTIGVTGPISLAEFVQEAFHSTVAEGSRVALWNDQIRNNVHANLYVNWTREWNLLPNPFSVHFALNPGVAFGTRDIYLQNDVAFYFGKRQDLQNTIAYNQLGSTQNELFFAIRLGYRNVIHDAMFEGHLMSDNSPFLLNPYPNVAFYNFEMYYRWKRNDFKLSYNHETPRNRRSFPHAYISLTYARSY